MREVDRSRPETTGYRGPMAEHTPHDDVETGHGSVLTRVLRRVLMRVYRLPARDVTITPATFGLAAQDVTLAAVDGTQLRGWLIPVAGNAGPGDDRRGPGPAVVVMHGWGSCAGDLMAAAPALVDAGIATLMLDARGHGSSGPAEFMSLPRFGEDIETAVAWLRADPRIDPDRIALVGHSVGAGAALLVAALDRHIVAVVSIASMADPAAVMTTRMRRLRLPARLVEALLGTVEQTIGHSFPDFAPVHTIARIGVPVLVVHGLADATVSADDAVHLAQVGPTAELLLVPAATHDDLGGYLGVMPQLVAHLRRAMESAGS